MSQIDPEIETEPAGATSDGNTDGNTDDNLRTLSDEARRLAASVTGPLRSIRLRSGADAVELEWATVADAPARPAPALRSPRSALSTPDIVADLSDVDEEPEKDALLVRAPMVGTFYHAAAPADAPFVAVGGVVAPDTVVGIIEAMKLMNRITADQHGVVREVLVDNGQPVEFEQPLIVLDPLPSED